MERVRVVQIAKGLGLGGTEKALELYTRYLNPELFEVVVVGMNEGGIRGERLASLGFEVEVMHGSRERLVKFLREKKVQIVHFHRPGLPDPDIPQAVQEAGVPVLIETNVFGRLDLTRMGELFDYHLFMSKTCALRYIDWLGKGLLQRKKGKIGVLYNPIDFDEFNLTNDRSPASTRELPINRKEERVIGFISRPDPAKIEISYIKKSLELSLKRGISCYLLAMGMPEIHRRDLKKAGLSEFCIFLEPTADPFELRRFYQLPDVFLNASPIGETFGLAIAEAMANGKPVVTNLTPLHDTAQIEVVDHGETGYVAYGNQAYAEAVVELLNKDDLRKEMGRKAYVKAKNMYDVQKLSRGLAHLYLELLRKKGAQIPHEIIAKYEDQRLPAYKEIEAFREEYWKRLRLTRGEVPSLVLQMHKLLRNRYVFMMARLLKQMAKGR